MKPIAILGAGIAGLTAARELNRRGLPAIVFEAGKAVGGMAASYKDAEGFSYDVGAHFVSNRLAEALGARDICRTVPRYGEAVRVGAKVYNYPFGLLASPRFVAGAVRSRLSGPAPSEADTADTWFRRSYGDDLAEAVAIPLAEAWSGAAAGSLAPSVGQKFGSGILKTMVLKAASRATGRAVCIGYSHHRPESPSVYHVYPEGGLANLLAPMKAEVDHLVRLDSPVQKILVEEGRVRAVRVGGAEIPVSAVISTAPVNVLPKLVEGTAALDHLARFRYRPMLFVNLRFEGRGLLPDTMLWTPDRSLPFFRLTEAPISMPWLAPEGKTLITCDIGCEVGDRFWTMGDAELADLCLSALGQLMPGLRARFISAGGVVRTPHAYPVYLKAYEAERQAFARTTGVDGLYSIGRNGEFAHILMEDIYWRTIDRAAEIEAFVRAGGAGGAGPAVRARQPLGQPLSLGQAEPVLGH